jgi:hypothetical protein
LKQGLLHTMKLMVRWWGGNLALQRNYWFWQVVSFDYKWRYEPVTTRVQVEIIEAAIESSAQKKQLTYIIPDPWILHFFKISKLR